MINWKENPDYHIKPHPRSIEILKGTMKKRWILISLIIVMLCTFGWLCQQVRVLDGPYPTARDKVRGIQGAAKARIELLETALDAFCSDIGRYPKSDEGLNALMERPAGVENWKGPYLPKGIPLDPWKRPYVYSSPGKHGDYDIISFGADGVEGGEGENRDIVSWIDRDK
jgi:type II secretion system protein G